MLHDDERDDGERDDERQRRQRLGLTVGFLWLRMSSRSGFLGMSGITKSAARCSVPALSARLG
jgi:hypothetical protein